MPDQLYEALLAERYGPPPAPAVRPVLLSRQRADAADLFGVGGVPRTPPQPRPDDDVLRMVQDYRWSPRQAAALLGITDDQVTRILACHGLAPALEEREAA